MVQKFISLPQSTQKFLQDESYYLQAGKVQALLRLLKGYQAEGRRMLIFSQVGISSNHCLSNTHTCCAVYPNSGYLASYFQDAEGQIFIINRSYGRGYPTVPGR